MIFSIIVTEIPEHSDREDTCPAPHPIPHNRSMSEGDNKAHSIGHHGLGIDLRLLCIDNWVFKKLSIFFMVRFENLCFVFFYFKVLRSHQSCRSHCLKSAIIQEETVVDLDIARTMIWQW
jgi:hypothetical protein